MGAVVVVRNGDLARPVQAGVDAEHFRSDIAFFVFGSGEGERDRESVGVVMMWKRSPHYRLECETE